MSPEQKRKFNTVFGAGFLVTGLIAWGGAVFIAATPNPPKPAPVISSVLDLTSCKLALDQIGYSRVTIDGTNAQVSLHEPMTSEPKEQLLKASSAMGLCRMKLQTFCMGPGCPEPGLSLVMRTKPELVANIPKAPSDTKPKPSK